MKSLSFLGGLAFLLLASLSASAEFTVPDTPYDGPVTAQMTSDDSLDGPKLDHVNSTAFDWWYFDVVAPDLKSSMVIAFFTATSGGFPLLLSPTDITTAAIWYSWPNGTYSFNYFIPEEARITITGEGSAGIWGDSGWMSAPDLSSYVLTVNATDIGIVGNLNLKSRAPAHYPCGPATSGQTMEVGPNIGWANAIPDADGSVDFVIGGEALKFSGRGYHDKNWSAQAFLTNVGSWYWGHGTLGDWSIVWFDFLDPNGTEFVSAYASRNGKIVVATCDIGSISVRPSGANNEYPPTLSSGTPGGFHIQLWLGDEGVMEIDVTTEELVATDLVVSADAKTVVVGDKYRRWIGGMKGSLNQGDALTGIAMFEEFKTMT